MQWGGLTEELWLSISLGNGAGARAGLDLLPPRQVIGQLGIAPTLPNS